MTKVRIKIVIFVEMNADAVSTLLLRVWFIMHIDLFKIVLHSHVAYFG